MRSNLEYFGTLCLIKKQNLGFIFFQGLHDLLFAKNQSTLNKNASITRESSSNKQARPFVPIRDFPPWMNVFVIIISTVGKRSSSLGNVMPLSNETF